MVRSATVRQIARRLVRPAAGWFGEDDLATVPAPVARMMRAAIAEGTPCARSARIVMHGDIRLGGRWRAFHADETLTPGVGFVWAARVGLVTGYDRLVDGRGGMRWRMLGAMSVQHADGPDVTRSAAGRLAGESVWLPTALLPRFGTRWHVVDETHVVADVTCGGLVTSVHHHLDQRGHVESVWFDRWGDPDGTGTWGLHTFGMRATGRREFAGLTIPSEGVAGWHVGTPREQDGAFFRFTVTALQPQREQVVPAQRGPTGGMGADRLAA